MRLRMRLGCASRKCSRRLRVDCLSRSVPGRTVSLRQAGLRTAAGQAGRKAALHHVP
jgi:hypothetical protein